MLASPPVAAAISPMMDALYNGRADEAQRILSEAGANRLTVHEAAAMGVVSRLEELLMADPDAVNSWSPDGFQPLPLAAFFGRRAAAELLLARGGEVNTPARHPFHVTSLHAALSSPDPSFATQLIAAGADINARQQGGETPLHEAAFIGHVELAQLLLQRGAEAKAADDKGRTPADIARERGHSAIVELLEQRSSR
jgi:ankyrin repeat protein